MSEKTWIGCCLLGMTLGIILRIGVSNVVRVQTPKRFLTFLISGLGIFAVIQGMLLYIVLSVAKISEAIVPAIVAVGIADVIGLITILLCFFTRRKRHLTDEQKMTLLEL